MDFTLLKSYLRFVRDKISSTLASGCSQDCVAGTIEVDLMILCPEGMRRMHVYLPCACLVTLLGNAISNNVTHVTHVEVC